MKSGRISEFAQGLVRGIAQIGCTADEMLRPPVSRPTSG